MFHTALRLTGGYLGVLAIASGVTWGSVSLHAKDTPVQLASIWKDAALVDRVVLGDGKPAPVATDGAEVVSEKIVADGPILGWPDLALGMSFVPGHDGVEATLGERKVLVTPDELLSRQIYDHGLKIQTISVALGLDTEKLFQLLADKLESNTETLREHVTLRRIRVERTRGDERPRVTGPSLGNDEVRAAIIAGAHYLARGITPEGRFRYTVSAPTNEDMPGYDWPRHAGATFFVAQVAGMTHDPTLVEAAKRAGMLMTASGLSTCGTLPCVGDESRIGLGSTALAVVALTELVDKKIEPNFAFAVVGLAKFLRSQQRPDGEFMHYYDRTTNTPVDYQGLYYSSEAALALARAYKVTKDPADRDAAVRSLAYLVGPGWKFVGNRYYFGEEHWTCQAMAELWPHSPNREALDFCLRWHEFGRALQGHEGDSYFDSDGAVGVGPVITPRLTPVASRCEAGVATLAVAREAGVPKDEIDRLEAQLRRSLALLVRQQLRPGPRHLFKDPAAINGAMPGSEVDWELRIDYTQHAGSAMVRWLDLQH